jgi:hypothetical protein
VSDGRSSAPPGQGGAGGWYDGLRDAQSSIASPVATFLRPSGAKRAAFDVQTFPKARALGLRMSAPLVLAVGVGEGVGVWGRVSGSALSRAEGIFGAYRWLARKARRATGNERAPETGEEGRRP